MSWLLPSALAIAGVATLAVVALHFIARSRPLAESLPTARFIPQRPVHARARSVALSDVLLLLVRVAAVIALGAAVAAPVFAAARGRVRRLVLVDRSRDVRDVGEARDSARRVLRAGDIVVVFDSSAGRTADVHAIDSLARVGAAGSLSAAVAAALRAAVPLSSDADSIELDLVSPLAADEVDAATLDIRAQWPGRIRIIPIGAAAPSETERRVESANGNADAVVAGLSLMGVMHDVGTVRLVRGRLSAPDSVWARDSGHVLVHWPASDSAARWPPRPTIDVIGGVTTSSGTLVGRFPRPWSLSGPAVARWADGEPAAVERVVGRGCIRDVGIALDPASDITLRAPFRQFVERLLEPCGGERRSEPIDAARLASIAGDQRWTHLAAASALREQSSESSPWTRWLLALGALLLLVELAARRPGRRPA